MKYILLLLLSFNLYADPAEDARRKVISDKLELIGIDGNTYESQGVIARLLVKCGINFNSAFYYDEIFKVENASDLDCFISKKPDVDADNAQKAAKLASRRTLLETARDYDCNLESGYTKILCQLRK